MRKWYEEIFDQNGELVAMATILTLVAKKSPFVDVDRKYLEEKFMGLTESTTANWGIMTAQHMVEHLEFFFHMATGEVEGVVITPENRIEKYQESLWNYRKMPEGFDHPALRKGKTEDLNHPNLEAAKTAALKAYDDFEAFFKENPEAKTANTVFGELDKWHWDLVTRKHTDHHFRQFGLV